MSDLYDKVIELQSNDKFPYLGDFILSSSKIASNFSKQIVSKEQCLEDLKYEKIIINLSSIEDSVKNSSEEIFPKGTFFLSFKILNGKFNFSPASFNSDKNYNQLEEEIKKEIGLLHNLGFNIEYKG